MIKTSLGLFLLSLATLLVEVLLTRVFDVLLAPHLSFLVITCAMFGLALGGLFDVLRGARTPSLTRPAALFALTTWALPLLLNSIPFSLAELGRHPLAQAAYFLALYLVLLAPFFFAGLCVCRIFTNCARDIHRLYGWDLSGAAIGAALLIPALPPIGPERLLMVAGVVGLIVSALLADRASWRAVAALAAVAIVVPHMVGDRYLTLALHDDKRDARSAIDAGRLEFLRWDPVSTIAVLDRAPTTSHPEDHGRKHIAYDGGTQSSDFFPFNGDFAALRRDLPNRLPYQFWRRGVLASHYLRRDTGHTALIIGAAGGQETKAALMYGASHVDTVEMVGTMVDLATGKYSDYIGRLFQRPEVSPHIGEGRSFLRASSTRYDVIQIFSNYTSSSLASGSGAVAPNYLLTTDAFADYFGHLTPNGILHINHVAYPRMISTAAAAWRTLGRIDFRSHVLVAEAADGDDWLPTMLIKMTPWTPAEVADATEFFSWRIRDEPRYAIVENPFDPAHSFLPDVFYSGELPPALLRDAPYDPRAVTDDRPFFQFMRRAIHPVTEARTFGLNASTAALLNVQLRRRAWPADWEHLIIASAVSVFYGALFVIVPLLVSRVGRESWPGKAPALVYFSLLGFGFIAIELVFIQLFMKLIGYPLYAITTVITVMLLGAGAGSRSSRRLLGERAARWPIAFVGIAAAGLAVTMLEPEAARTFMAASMPVRIAVAAAMIFPVAFFMGMPFPMGIAAIASQPTAVIAWAWSMNGLWTTIGGVATAISSLILGFHATLLTALVVYALAGFTFAALREPAKAPVVTTRRRPLEFMRSAVAQNRDAPPIASGSSTAFVARSSD